MVKSSRKRYESGDNAGEHIEIHRGTGLRRRHRVNCVRGSLLALFIRTSSDDFHHGVSVRCNSIAHYNSRRRHNCSRLDCINQRLILALRAFFRATIRSSHICSRRKRIASLEDLIFPQYFPETAYRLLKKLSQNRHIPMVFKASVIGPQLCISTGC